MLSQNTDRPLLTLKHAMQRSDLSRLKPCGSLQQQHSDIACTVFVKRSRLQSADDDRLHYYLPRVPQQALAPVVKLNRKRNRKGSFLRLATIRSPSSTIR